MVSNRWVQRQNKHANGGTHCAGNYPAASMLFLKDSFVSSLENITSGTTTYTKI